MSEQNESNVIGFDLWIVTLVIIMQQIKTLKGCIVQYHVRLQLNNRPL